jgi:hypothetical protein
MDIRIDSKLAANSTSYRVISKGDQIELSRTRAGYIKRKGYTCSVPNFEHVLKSQTTLKLEDFGKSDLTAKEEVWESLFVEIVPFQQSCWTSDATQHDPGAQGFADGWLLTTEVSGLIRLSASIFDYCDSNYHHDSCSHEAEDGVALKVLEIVGATSHANLMELSENFEREGWKSLHDSIPSSQGCKWLDKWRA